MQEALTYHERHKPQALLVARDGKLVVEAYGDGFSADKPHALYSGTKSFWGPLAILAQREKLLELDETVGATFPAWRDDPVKKKVTLRMLLSLTAGIGFGGLGSAVPVYEKALATLLRDPPGTKFTYGGIPLQIFGAVLAQKLAPQKLTPHEYLRERILNEAGVEIASWRKLADGTQPLPTGAFLTATNWLRYGEYILQRLDEFAECFEGTAANPRYGLCWWLAPPGAPADTVYASGSGGQALYVIPSLRLVAVRFGNGGSYNHGAFLKRLNM
ncbi:MAG TPA: serine hydrolase [Candidatus Rubrimentiphilum sp.]|nr:serine hydrolase [Candidatus Rubrimentiphilum sp.]